MSPTDVKQTIAITSTDTLQKYVGTSATDIGSARIKAVQAQSSAADGSVKIYDATSASTASTLVFEAKWGTAANESFTFYLPQNGIRCKTAMHAVLSNCDFLVVTFD
jgi:hypothetical protein